MAESKDVPGARSAAPASAKVTIGHNSDGGGSSGSGGSS